MAEETRIKPEVDASELEEAIAQIEEAIKLKNQYEEELGNIPPIPVLPKDVEDIDLERVIAFIETGEVERVVENIVSAESTIEDVLTEADNLEEHLTSVSERAESLMREVDEVSERTNSVDELLNGVLKKEDDARQEADSIAESVNEILGEGEEIRGINLLTSRVLSRLPGLREAYRLSLQIQTLIRVSPQIALLLASLQLLLSLMNEMRRREEEITRYEDVIREYRNLSREEARAWIEEDRKRTSENYRSQVPP